MQLTDRDRRVQIVLERSHKGRAPQVHFSRFHLLRLAQGAIQGIQAALCLVEQIRAEVQLRAVVGRQQCKAQHLAGILSQQVLDHTEIAQGFGHLLAIDIHIAVVHPVTHEVLAVGAAALCPLVFVVRKSQVAAAAVNIDGVTQVLLDHGRALEVPAGTATAPGAIPTGLFIAGRLPQHEVARVFFIGRHFDPRAGQHVVQRALRQLAVIGHGLHCKQHVPFRRVGVALLDQPFDHGDHFRQVLGGIGNDIRLEIVERGHILGIGLGKARRQDADLLAVIPRGLHDLVVDIGDIARIDHVAEVFLQQAIERIEHDDRAGVADMHAVIDGGPTDVHAHAVVHQGFKNFFLSGESVVEL